jgi:hypothetical protein
MARSGAQGGARLGDEEAPAGLEDAVGFGDHPLRFGQDDEEPRDDHGVERGVGGRQAARVPLLEGTVVQRARRREHPGASQLQLRAVHAGNVQVPESLPEAAGVEAGAAAQLEQAAAGGRDARGPQAGGYPPGVVAKEVVAAEGVEPVETVEEALGVSGEPAVLAGPRQRPDSWTMRLPRSTSSASAK